MFVRLDRLGLDWAVLVALDWIGLGAVGLGWVGLDWIGLGRTSIQDLSNIY